MRYQMKLKLTHDEVRVLVFALMKIPAGIAPPFQQMGTAIPEIRYRYSCSWIPRI